MAEAFDHSLCAELGEEVESVERITNFTYVVECALPTICDPIDDCNLSGIFDAIGIAGVGTQGPQGPQGPADGPQGSQGPQGDVGAQGTPGVNGAQGAQGPQGAQGATGNQGAQGPFGGNSRGFTFDSTTTDSDPGAGKLRLNNAAMASATQAYVDILDASGANVTAWLDSLDDYGSNSNHGTIHLFKLLDVSIYYVYTLTLVITATGYRKLSLTYMGGNGTFSDGDSLVLSFVYAGPTGAVGAQGATGAQGTTGAQGAAGAQGPQGANGSAGAQGPQGHQGTQGPQGHQGTQGPQGDGGSSGFSIGTLAATMQRADTGKAFTTTAGDSACTSVGDYTSQLPGGITLSIGTTLAAHKVGANWSIWPPGYLFTLKGSCGTITAGGSGSVVTSYGTVTAYNDSPYSTASGWCVIAWDEPNNRWMIVNFDPVCP